MDAFVFVPHHSIIKSSNKYTLLLLYHSVFFFVYVYIYIYVFLYTHYSVFFIFILLLLHNIISISQLIHILCMSVYGGIILMLFLSLSVCLPLTPFLNMFTLDIFVLCPQNFCGNFVSYFCFVLS